MSEKPIQFDIDLASEHQELFLEARALLLSFDGIVETKKQRITTYSNGSGGICHMRTMPRGIDIGFLKGAKMDDDYQILKGKGKAIRVLPLKQLDEQIVRYYVEQAIDINANK